TAGAKLDVRDGAVSILKEGKVKKLVDAVEQISFSGPRAVAQGQDILYVTERCVLRLEREGVTVTEIAPGVDLKRDILAQAEFPLRVADGLCKMDAALFHPEPFKLELRPAREPLS
ncbi:MAG TPA: acyl CoA:acetate/3-ketoacid CoA transferase, partial [Roseiarcus sp.]|nr:acyl CoA:acetate/3-ketoacid CoA transferase [Roseiarcus sp.]